MVLVDHQIRVLCELGFVNPYNPEMINPSSLDIRIGTTAMEDRGWGIFDFVRKWLVDNLVIPTPNKSEYDYPINKWLRNWIKDQKENYYFKRIDFTQYSKENPYYLKPKECILVSTLESVNVPPNIQVQLKLKSSRAREGIDHALAGWVDGGFQGILTLEVVNNSRFHDIPLYPGLRFGQLIMFQSSLPDRSYRETGRYGGYDKVMPSLDK